MTEQVITKLPVKRLTPEVAQKLPLAIGDIEAAQKLLTPVIDRTEMQPSRALSRQIGADVYLKTENLQRAGSFKVRGAYVRIAKIPDSERERGIVAASAGNHAQGVALAAESLGIKARIYMPLDAALPKIAATKGHQAEVILYGNTVDEALSEAKRYAREAGAIFIHPFDNADIVAGQGTIGLEVLEQVPDVETVVVAAGGGGLLAGVALAAKAKAEQRGTPIRVIGVQAEQAAAYPPSLVAETVKTLPDISTMADGIAVGRPGDIPFAIVKELVDGVVTVSEDGLARTMIFLLERTKMVVEPAGAISVAALQEGKLKEAGINNPGTTVCVLSGGNIDPMLMLKVIQRGLYVSGRFLTIRMMLRDRPGELAVISRIIADAKANVTGVYHTRVGDSLRMGDVTITINMETKGHTHAREVLDNLRSKGYNPITGVS